VTETKVHRVCAGCQQIDDHPRHVFAVAGGQVPPMPWHMDCHVIATGCEDCAEQLKKANTTTSNDGIKGAQLQELLIALRDDSQEG
jgi:hypothetical protein